MDEHLKAALAQLEQLLRDRGVTRFRVAWSPRRANVELDVGITRHISQSAPTLVECLPDVVDRLKRPAVNVAMLELDGAAPEHPAARGGRRRETHHLLEAPDWATPRKLGGEG